MIKQAAWIIARSLSIGLFATLTGVLAHAGIFHDAFDYAMSEDEQRKILVVSGDVILGGAMTTGAIAGLLSLAFGGIELGYWFYRNRQATKMAQKLSDEAKKKLGSTATLTDAELIKLSALANE